jgi:hypothetical protein
MDKFHSPKMDESIVKAVMDCAKCKGFGLAHLHSLLDPVVRRHPFELLVGDYLLMPLGVGGYDNVRLYLDTCSQHVWGFMYKTAGSADTTVVALNEIFGDFLPSDTFMADQGWHFKNKKVEAFCDK